ncbi:flagellar motor switch protein FliN [Oceanidesulfovibrio marinus]|uniref:Flagellar motor switch protein FliN n=1 Tax=Oceanidesulfovibrio marinus TaxID=370038 RepID=A0A6P1ZJV5_9BACT|nr:flagellar motor switch protein FliN [Oceanidesulfovibrio marinus]QJT10010.1 flagellar motor switch protein FliN [Oceanidesulfovibrio marinus]TVM35872.1 flagellar motor switch protein FliN [Oceanidesulfovibrio marinus]
MADEDQEKLAAEWAAALAEQDSEDIPEDFGEDLGTEQAAQDTGGGGVESPGSDVSEDEALADEWAKALAEDESAQLSKKKTEQQSLSNQASTAQFKDLTEEAKSPRTDGTKHELDFILDIPLDVSAELGRTRLLINELLQLGQGSVVELNKLAGEPLEIYVNGKLVARGEAVVINEKFGVRLTDIISPIERVKQLG